MSMNGILVPLEKLPSKGYGYPPEMALYVKPLKIKDQIDMERYGVSDSEYFRILLEGISIEGCVKNKESLYHFDVQFLDLVRRLYSFDTEEYIEIEGCKCQNPDCEEPFNYKFKMEDIYFTDFDGSIFNKHFVLGEGTEDELEIVVNPITVADFMRLSREAKNYKVKRTILSAMYTEYLCACVTEVVGREFKGIKDRNAFLYSYFEDIYRAKDKKILKQISDETVSVIEPFKYTCPICGEVTEVLVTPTSNFQQ